MGLGCRGIRQTGRQVHLKRGSLCACALVQCALLLVHYCWMRLCSTVYYIGKGTALGQCRTGGILTAI